MRPVCLDIEASGPRPLHIASKSLFWSSLKDIWRIQDSINVLRLPYFTNNVCSLFGHRSQPPQATEHYVKKFVLKSFERYLKNQIGSMNVLRLSYFRNNVCRPQLCIRVLVSEEANFFEITKLQNILDSSKQANLGRRWWLAETIRQPCGHSAAMATVHCAKKIVLKNPMFYECIQTSVFRE